LSGPAVVTPAKWSDDYSRNALWCRLVAEELVGGGVRDVVVCPGGRSAALALQLDHTPALRTLVLTDERGGAFVALGIARASGRPVAVCTTSGTAVANLLPALAEAEADALPLVALTCDRPRSLRDAGAPQTTEQLAPCAPFVRAAVDLTDPVDATEALADLRSAVAGLLARATLAGASGPVQLNIPLEGEFDSTEIDPAWHPPETVPARSRHDAAAAPRPGAGEAAVAALAEPLGLRPGLRGLIVAGPDSPLTWTEVDALARATAFPVLADAYTGLRTPAVANVVCEAEALVLHPRLSGVGPEIVLRLGGAPLGQTVHRYLAALPCPVIRIAGRPVERDFLSRSFRVLERPDAGALAALGRALAPGDPEWLGRWLEVSSRARAGIAAAVEALPWGESAAAAIACRADGFDFLHLANSMPVRHGNLHIGPGRRSLSVYANRGLNGIDGTLGTFLGELRGSGRRGLLLVGDQAAQHDLPALAAARDEALDGAICILTNGGGALFDLLPCSRLDGYDRAVRNPRAVDFGAIAAAFGLPFRRCADRAALEAALAESSAGDGVAIIEAAVANGAGAREFMGLYATTLS
jgi:2-succinyl-5-enolpyruvyl-6-hydroxy-3-cyclohexene-1-carboxylate synthase